MKRLIAFTLTFLMLFSLYACGDIDPVPQGSAEKGSVKEKSADDLLLEKRESFVLENRLFSEGRVYEATYSADEEFAYGDFEPYESAWIKEEGVLTTFVYDLDNDDSNELYTLKLEHEGDSMQLVSEVFYVENGKIKSAGSIVTDGGSIYGETLYNVKAFLAQIDGKMRICLENTTTYMFDADRGPQTLSVYEYKDNSLSEYITVKGSEGTAPWYSITTPEESFEIDLEAVMEDEYVLLDTLNDIGYPEPDNEAMSPENDKYLGGYGDSCSYYDHKNSVKLCRITSKYLHHDSIMGNSNYIVFDFVDNTDTHKDFVKEDNTPPEGDIEAIPPAYAEILSLYIDGFDYWQSGDIPTLEGESYLYMYYDDLSDVSYALYDIDDNVTDELLMYGFNEETYDRALLDVYTLKDDKVLHLADSGERYMYSACHEGIFYQRWSSSAFNSGESWFRINDKGDALEHIVSLFYDFAPGSQTDTCLYVSYKPDLTSKQVINEEDYDKFVPEYTEMYFSTVTLQEYILN